MSADLGRKSPGVARLRSLSPGLAVLVAVHRGGPHRHFAVVASLALLAGCSSPKPAQPQTQPIEDSPSPSISATTSSDGGPYAVGQRFTLAWKEAEATDQPEDVNLTITVTKFDRGAGANALLKAGMDYYKANYGQSSTRRLTPGTRPSTALVRVG
jgi:hypothetical protein